jgi:hypothetical protein
MDSGDGSFPVLGGAPVGAAGLAHGRDGQT